jgi:dTDP-4-dehydrorhamnose 3,5-epimerase
VIFTPTKLPGAFVVKPEQKEDFRGLFARSYCLEEFERQGLNPRVVQCSISFNKKRGTLRGMHYQAPPHPEVKLVRCTRGAVYDVMIDLRRDSPTFREWTAEVLSAENRHAFYIPEGFAHGFQTLEDNSEVFYQMSEFYHPESARGVRYDDPLFKIRWPIADPIIIDRDREYPDFPRDARER